MKEYTKDEYVEKLNDSTDLSKGLLSKFTKGDLRAYFKCVANPWQISAAQATLYGGAAGGGAVWALNGFASSAAFFVFAFVGAFASSYLKAGNRKAIQEMTERAAAVSQPVPKPA